MKNLLVILSLLVVNTVSFAKVAYLPLFDAHDLTNIKEDSILVIDLDDGKLLKKIRVGNGVGAVFLNSQSDKLYASAKDDNKIVLIETTTLDIVQEWTGLAIKPEQIILNKADNVLYFSEYNHDSIYQIDLVTNQISIALTLPGFQRFWFSDNLDTIAFKIHDVITGDYNLHVYDLNDMSPDFVRLVGDTYSYFIDNDGLRFYYPYFGFGRLYSYNYNDFVENWYFSYVYAPGPLGGLNDTFANVFPLQNNKILAVGWHGAYEVDKDTGVGVRISGRGNYNNPYQRITEYTFLKASRPELPFCGVTPPGLDCNNYFPLQVFIQNHQTSQEVMVYEQDRAGTYAQGRYVGEKLYSVPVIPLLSTPLLLVLIMLLLVFAYKTRLSQY